VNAPAYTSPTGVEVLFWLLGLVALASAVLVVTTRQLVHAALWLVVTLGALAGCYLLLTAEFVAWVQVLIYVGAVVVLLLFGLMLTRAPVGVAEGLDSGNRPAAVLVAAGVAGVLVTSVVDAFRHAYVDLGDAAAGTAQVAGDSIFRTWVLPFEALSVLLLAALVAAIVLSRGDIGSRDAPAEAGPGDRGEPGEPGEPGDTRAGAGGR
jgi:NADH-quinone oxidoreductase subunit J